MARYRNELRTPGRVDLHKALCRIEWQGRVVMPTNLGLDDKLIERARKIGRHKTKKEAVTVALEEYVRLREQRAVLQLEGTIDFDPSYDYKAARRRKR